MIGTFYWHNQFAAFLLAPAILGLALILANRAPLRFVGWIVTPFAVAGIVYSSSRGSEMALAAGWLLVGGLSLRSGARARVFLGRWLAASVLAAVVAFGLAGPPFFSTRHVPWASTQARAATGETLGQNSNVRIYFWRQAVIVFEHEPVVGVGYGALSDEAVKLTPAGWPRSPLAHNDYLQSLAEGGLVLGGPFLLACGGIALWSGRRMWAFARRGTKDPLRVGVVVAAVVVLAHASIDFDWTYPALFASAGAVCGLMCAEVVRGRQRLSGMAGRRRGSVAAYTATAMLACALVVGAVTGRHGGVSLVYHSPAPTTSAAVDR
jgi:O-antigen ligase